MGVTNLVYNVLTARMLGPTGFAHATAVYTLLMLASAITLSFQVVCAKYVASHEDGSEKNAIFARLHHPGVDRRHCNRIAVVLVQSGPDEISQSCPIQF